MKRIFTNLLIFGTLVIVFSAMSACSKLTTTTQNGSNGASAGASPGGETEKKRSDYPPIATAVAQGDIKNLDGTTFKIADKKGKVLLLNLWATWCGPCRSEMPTLVRMQDTHRDQGFEVIGMNTDDETADAINKFAADMKLNYALVWPDTGIQSALLNISKFNGIPQSFIVDRDGNLRGVFRGANPADVKKMEQLVEMVVSE